MGIILQEVAFPARAPDLRRIAEEVHARSGLEVSVTESSEEVKGDLFDLYAQLAFACAPEERIVVFTYRSGVVRTPYEGAWENPKPRPAGLERKASKGAKAMVGPEGKQVIYLRGQAEQEQELTLLFATQLALERLGGVSPFPLTDQQRSEYDRPFTAAELAPRRREWRTQMKWGLVETVLLLPVTIPLKLIQWIVIAILHIAWKMGRAAKALLGFGSGP